MHFLYPRFPAAQHRTVVEWMRVVDDVLATFPAVRTKAIDAGQPGPVLGWRLLSENNREIARGAVLFSAEHLAHADTDRVVGAHGHLVHPAPARPMSEGLVAGRFRVRSLLGSGGTAAVACLMRSNRCASL